MASAVAPGSPARRSTCRPGRHAAAALLALGIAAPSFAVPSSTADAQTAPSRPSGPRSAPGGPTMPGDKAAVERIAQSIVKLRAQVPADARSAARLGTTREGAGTIVRLDGAPDGLIVTVGYLVMEASSVEVTDHAGRKRGAEVVGYDHASGLGLVRLVGAPELPALEIGDSQGLAVRQPVIVSDGGGVGNLHPAIITSVRLFAGAWEYLLEHAIYAAPPVEDFGGAALMDGAGKLIGVGSLIVNDGPLGQQIPANVFVPADMLRPIVADMVATGRPKGPSRPWLGLNADDLQGGLLIIGNVTRDGPARKAGLRRNDVVLSVAGQPVKGLADFYRRVWSLGEAGVEVPLQVMQRDGIRDVQIKSDDRYKYLKVQPTY